jgi:hypothetical protein
MMNNFNYMVVSVTGGMHLFQTRKEKREVPATLRKILAADAFLTDRFCNWANCFLPLRSLRVHYKVLEVKVI